jgi:hypothetical protein
MTQQLSFMHAMYCFIREVYVQTIYKRSWKEGLGMCGAPKTRASQVTNTGDRQPELLGAAGVCSSYA